MTTEPTQSLPPERDPALLARLAADEELSAEQARALDALSATPDARVSERVAFEHALRDSVSRVMSDAPPAPDALRERILAALRGDAEQQAPEPIPFRTPEPARPSGHTGPFRLGWILAAAALVGVAAIALLVPNQTGVGPSTTQRSAILPAATAERLVSFLDSSHDKCANFGDVFKQKMIARTHAEAAEAAIAILPRVPDVLELPDERLAVLGYRFAGLGRCAVPGKGRSAHLIYRSITEADAVAISLFVQEDTGELPLEEGTKCYCAGLCKDGKKQVTVWRREMLIFYLVAPADLQPRAREVFGAPQEQQSLI